MTTSVWNFVGLVMVGTSFAIEKSSASKIQTGFILLNCASTEYHIFEIL